MIVVDRFHSTLKHYSLFSGETINPLTSFLSSLSDQNPFNFLTGRSLLDDCYFVLFSHVLFFSFQQFLIFKC